MSARGEQDQEERLPGPGRPPVGVDHPLGVGLVADLLPRVRAVRREHVQLAGPAVDLQHPDAHSARPGPTARAGEPVDLPPGIGELPLEFAGLGRQGRVHGVLRVRVRLRVVRPADERHQQEDTKQ